MPKQEKRPTERGGRQRKPQPRKTAPEVVYTPGRQFNRRRLLLRLVTIVAVAFAFFLGLSIFFKVDTITVSGCDKYSAWTVSEASGIEKGQNLLFFGESAAASKIIDALPYVKSVRFTRTLPSTVNIIIEEAPVGYALQDTAGTWWLITAQGRVTEKVDAETAGRHTNLKGITLENPVVGADAVAREPSEETSVTAADRLTVALQIATQLEANEMIGVIASVDVSNLQAIEMWYGNRYQVKLGNNTELDFKIAAVRSAVAEMSTYQTGILDASFTTFSNSVGYMPFGD